MILQRWQIGKLANLRSICSWDGRRLIGVYANMLVGKGKSGITDFFPCKNVSEG